MYGDDILWKVIRVVFLMITTLTLMSFVIQMMHHTIPTMLGVTIENTEEEAENHEHSFGEWIVTTEATEENEGVMTRKCDCGEVETLPIPKIEKTVADTDFGEVKEEVNHFAVFGIVVGILILVGTISGIVIYNINRKKEEALAKILEKAENDDSEEEVKEEVNPFDVFQEKLLKNIEFLNNKKDDVENLEIRKSIEKSISIVNDIFINTDENEFRRGNIGRLNEMYLNSFKGIIENYINYQDYVKSKDVTKTLNELKDSIVKFEDIFGDILKEALDDDLLNASAETKTILNIAKMNGLLDEENLNSND